MTVETKAVVFNAVPLLVLHDPEDREVPFEEGAEVARRWPGAELRPVAGLGHLRILRDERWVGEAVACAPGSPRGGWGRWGLAPPGPGGWFRCVPACGAVPAVFPHPPARASASLGARFVVGGVGAAPGHLLGLITAPGVNW